MIQKNISVTQKIQITEGALNKMFTYAKLCKNPDGEPSEIYAYPFHNFELDGNWWVINDVLLPPSQISEEAKVKIKDLDSDAEFWRNLPHKYEPLGWMHSHANLHVCHSREDDENLENILREYIRRQGSTQIRIKNAEVMYDSPFGEGYILQISRGDEKLNFKVDDLLEVVKRMVIANQIANSQIKITKEKLENTISYFMYNYHKIRNNNYEDVINYEEIYKHFRLVDQKIKKNKFKIPYPIEFKFEDTKRNFKSIHDKIEKLKEYSQDDKMPEYLKNYFNKKSEYLRGLLFEPKKHDMLKIKKEVSNFSGDLLTILDSYNNLVDIINGNLSENDIKVGLLIDGFITFAYSIVVNVRGDCRGYVIQSYHSKNVQTPVIEKIKEVNVEVLKNLKNDTKFTEEQIKNEIKNKVSFN